MNLESLTGVLSYTLDDAGLKAAQRELRATNDANTELTAGHIEGAAWAEKHAMSLKGAATGAGLLAAAGAASTAVVLDAVSAAKEYDAVIANVATLSPQAAAKTGEYRQQVLELSASMGQNAVESANAMYDALSSGVPPDNVMTFMQSASKFAVAGATDVGTAVKGLAGTMNAWGLSAAEATNISDVFFQGQNLGVFRVDELAASIGGVSASAAALGISYKEIAAATATMTLQNKTASEAITQQKAAISSVITPNKDMDEVLKDLAVSYPEVAKAAKDQGISVGEAAFKTLGFQGTLEAVRESATNTGTVLAKATGSTEALSGVLMLTGDKAALAHQNLDAMNNAAGSSEAAFKTMSETTDMKWKVLQETINSVRITLGEAFLPVVSGALDLMRPLADVGLSVAHAFAEAPTPVKALVAVLGLLVTGGAAVAAMLAGLAAVFGPTVVAMGGMAGVTAALGAAWTGASATIVASAGAAAAAIAPLILPIVALSAVVIALKKGHDDLAGSMDKAYQGAKQAGTGFDAYVRATQKAKEETTGLGKVWATLSSNKGLDLQSSTQAWLTYGVGVDEALLKTDEFTKAQQKAGEEWRKTGDVEAYKNAMLAAADAASVAAGKGHLLTEEQKAQQAAFTDATAVLLERAGPMASALAQDEEFIAKQKELAAAVTDGNMTQQQALGEMNAYISKRAEQAAADAKAAQAAADGASAVEGAAAQYSSALQGLAGGNLLGYAPDREMGEKEINDLQKKNEKLRDERVAHFADMYNKRQEFQAQEAALIASGKTDELAKLREGYAAELEAQQTHLGQLAVNQIMSNLQAGTLAEDQAQLMLGSMQAAFPDADFLSGNLASMVHFSATLGGAMNGNREDALAMGAALQQVPADLDAGAAAAEDYEQRSVAAFQAAKAGAEESAAGTIESNTQVSESSAERAALTGENLQAEQGHLTTTASVAQTEGGKTETALRGVGGAAKTTAGQFAGSMGNIRTEVATLPGAMSKAAGDTQAQAGLIGRAFQVSGEQARAYGREARQGIEDAASANAAAASSAQELGSTGEQGHAKVAASAGASTRAVTEFGDSATTAYSKTKDAQKEVEEQTGRVETALKKVPKEVLVKTELPQYSQFMAKLDAILKKLKEIDNAAMHTAKTLAAIVRTQGELNGAGGSGGGGGSGGAGGGGGSTPVPVPGKGGGAGPGGAGGFSLPPGDTVNGLADAYGAAADGATAYADAAGNAASVGAQALTIMQEAIARLNAWNATEPNWDALWAGIYKPFLEQAPTTEGSVAWMINQWRDTSILGNALDDPKFKAQVDLIEASFARINELVASGDFENAKREWTILYGRIKEQEDRRHKAITDHLDDEKEALDDQIRTLRRQAEASGDPERFEKQIKALEDQKEAIDDQKRAEDRRHESVMNHLEDQNRAVQDGQQQQKEWQDEQARRLKDAQDAIKAEQKAYVDAENDAHNQVMGQIDAEAERRKGLHDAILTDIEERKRVEAEAYQTSQAALEEGARIIKEGVDAASRAIAGMRLEMDQAKLDLDIDGEKKKLESLTADVSAFSQTLGKLDRVETDPKKAREDERKKQAERVKLTTDAQREMLAKYRDMAGKEDQRTIDLMLAGFNVRATDADRIMAGIQAGLQGQADAQKGVVDAKQAELDKMQQAIDKAEIKAKVEKQAADDQLKVIEELKRRNTEAHTEYVRQLDAEKRIEDVRYKAEAQAIADLKKAEKERHEAQLKALNERYALELLRTNHTEEEVNRILAEQEAQAKRVSDAADARYQAAMAAVDAEAKRLQAQATAAEDSVRQRAAEMQRQLIEQLRTIAQAIGGDAGKAIDELLAKLLNGDTGIPAIVAWWKKVGEEGVRAFVTIGQSYQDMTEQKKKDDAAYQKFYQGLLDGDKPRTVLPGERLGQTTRRGRGGFRASHDWAAWHGYTEDPTAGALLPGGMVGRGPGGGAGSGYTPPPGGKGSGAWPYPWRYAKEAGDAMLNEFINPVNAGLAEMNAQLAQMGVGLSSLAPTFSGFGFGGGGKGGGKAGTEIDYHHYGDNVFVGDDAAQDFLVGLHMAP